MRGRWIDRWEEVKLIEHGPPWLAKLVVFALNTGVRLEEILSIRWRQVDLIRGVVTVIRSKNGENIDN